MTAVYHSEKCWDLDGISLTWTCSRSSAGWDPDGSDMLALPEAPVTRGDPGASTPVGTGGSRQLRSTDGPLREPRDFRSERRRGSPIPSTTHRSCGRWDTPAGT